MGETDRATRTAGEHTPRKERRPTEREHSQVVNAEDTQSDTQRADRVAYSVVIPSLGTRESLLVTIRAVQDQTRPPHEIIVSLPPDVHVSLPVGVHIVRAGRASSSAQRNAGARAAASPIVFFLDDDVLPEPDCAAEICRVWETWRDDVVGVVGTLTNPPQQGEPVRRLIRTLGWQSHNAYFGRSTRIMASGCYAHVQRPRETVEVEFAATHCCSFMRGLVCRESFSEEFDGYVMGEDLDFSARIRRHGIIVQTPHALAFHCEGVSTVGDRAARLYREAMPLAVFQWRHKARWPWGPLAWEWSQATRSLYLLVLGTASRDLAEFRAYRDGLRVARRYIAAHDRVESGTG
jgi:GT2 family glycosyltransferase